MPTTLGMGDQFTVQLKPLAEYIQPASKHHLFDDGNLLLDFDKAAFGTLVIQLPTNHQLTQISVHLGEVLNSEGRVNRNPDGCIRYKHITQSLEAGQNEVRLIIPADQRNTGAGAIHMPPEIGEVLPFRYAEIEGAEHIDPQSVEQIAVFYLFDDSAAEFESSDDVLNAVWDICKYSIKATTFCGVYVDGDRERIPYEGDAYINQLGHYCTDHEYDFARYSHEYLLQHPTWPTEWQLHTILIAWADYLYSGETASLEKFYPLLKAKTLMGLAREDGLISTESDLCTEEFERSLNFHNDSYIFKHGLRDLVDWPPGSFTQGGVGERDNHEMLPINTVVNAFHYHCLRLMVRIAQVKGCNSDVALFEERANLVFQSFNRVLFDSKKGIYIDGEGSSHASLHSNMFALAFDLVPTEHQSTVVDFVRSRGMACSVYGAQFLLEALYIANDGQAALELMRAQDDRSWWNMIKVGSTITLEAWDHKYKNNLDWNHAWGAAPANIIPRYLMGVQPSSPGFKNVHIKPQPGDLRNARLRHPTPLGPVEIEYIQNKSISIEIPHGMTAEIDLSLCTPQQWSFNNKTENTSKINCKAGKHLFTAT